ncbi:MAG: hypothetical protein R2762_12360 [Bryobacteraceae bacterium]
MGAITGCPHRAGRIAKAVDGGNGGLLERRGEKGTGEMRAVVLNEVQLGVFKPFADCLYPLAGTGEGETIFCPGTHLEPSAGASGGEATEILEETGPQGRGRQYGRPNRRQLRQKRGGLLGESGPVLDAIEALLFRCRGENAAA